MTNRILIVGAGGTGMSKDVLKRLITELEGMEVIEMNGHTGSDPHSLPVYGINRDDALSKLNTHYVTQLHEPEFPTFLAPKETRHKAQWKVENRGRKMK